MSPWCRRPPEGRCQARSPLWDGSGRRRSWCGRPAGHDLRPGHVRYRRGTAEVVDRWTEEEAHYPAPKRKRGES